MDRRSQSASVHNLIATNETFVANRTLSFRFVTAAARMQTPRNDIAETHVFQARNALRDLAVSSEIRASRGGGIEFPAAAF
jgi:hypothetical protein